MSKKGVNKVILVGNVGQDPETRAFPDGSSVTNISLATSEEWKDKKTGEQKQSTEWHRVVLRDRGGFKLGQIAGQYLKKGSKVYIEGSLKTRSYDKDGQKFYVTEIMADEMQMLDSKNEAAPVSGQRQQSAPSQSSALPADFDSDIPF